MDKGGVQSCSHLPVGKPPAFPFVSAPCSLSTHPRSLGSDMHVNSLKPPSISDGSWHWHSQFTLSRAMCLAVRTRARDRGSVGQGDRRGEQVDARSPYSSWREMGSNAGEVSACVLESSGARQHGPYWPQVLSSSSFGTFPKQSYLFSAAPACGGSDLQWMVTLGSHRLSFRNHA